jgi:hypothetical protein
MLIGRHKQCALVTSEFRQLRADFRIVLILKNYTLACMFLFQIQGRGFMLFYIYVQHYDASTGASSNWSDDGLQRTRWALRFAQFVVKVCGFFAAGATAAAARRRMNTVCTR